MNLEEIDKLTDEELRIKVAELNGFYSINKVEWCGMFGAKSEYRDVPDYLNDLNDCHEFEIGLLKGYPCDGRWEKYQDSIRVVMNDNMLLTIHATAEQRCKAFVLTMEAK